MATTPILPDWQQVEDRALELFAEHRNLEFGDSTLAALVEARAPGLADRALRLIELNGCLSFSQAFRIVRLTDREFDADDVLPFEEHAPVAVHQLAA